MADGEIPCWQILFRSSEIDEVGLMALQLTFGKAKLRKKRQEEISNWQKARRQDDLSDKKQGTRSKEQVKQAVKLFEHTLNLYFFY
jgi:hypothetical protein